MVCNVLTHRTLLHVGMDETTLELSARSDIAGKQPGMDAHMVNGKVMRAR